MTRQQPALGVCRDPGLEPAAYVEFVNDGRVETLIEAHEDASLALGGAPRPHTSPRQAVNPGS